MNPLHSISVRYADGRVYEGELVQPVSIREEHEPFQKVTDYHLRATAYFKPVEARTKDGMRLMILPTRVEAKTKQKDVPAMVTIEGENQTWNLFWCDLTAKP